MEHRKQKMESAFLALQPPKKIVSKEQMEAFYGRLLTDAQQRKERKERLASEKAAKEEEQLKAHMVGNPYRVGKSKGRAKKKR